MTRNQFRTFIETGANAIEPDVFFDTGRITDFNSIQDISYPYVWLVSPGTSPELNTNLLLFDNWGAEIHIGKQDKQDASNTESEAIIDECDMIARKLIILLNQSIDSYATATITSIGIQPFTKKHSRCESGVILSFTVNAPDTSNLC